MSSPSPEASARSCLATRGRSRHRNLSPPERDQSPVRLISVSLAKAPAEVQTLYVRAYNYGHTKDVAIGAAGDLPKECPAQYVPHGISAFITPAHSDTPWFVVITFTISRPGRYNLPRLMIRYTTGGRVGWQYQNINATVVIRDPATARPPASAGVLSSATTNALGTRLRTLPRLFFACTSHRGRGDQAVAGHAGEGNARFPYLWPRSLARHSFTPAAGRSCRSAALPARFPSRRWRGCRA